MRSSPFSMVILCVILISTVSTPMRFAIADGEDWTTPYGHLEYSGLFYHAYWSLPKYPPSLNNILNCKMVTLSWRRLNPEENLYKFDILRRMLEESEEVTKEPYIYPQGTARQACEQMLEEWEKLKEAQEAVAEFKATPEQLRFIQDQMEKGFPTPEEIELRRMQRLSTPPRRARGAGAPKKRERRDLRRLKEGED